MIVVINKKKFDDTLDYLDTLCNCDNKRHDHVYDISRETALTLYKQNVGYIKNRKNRLYFIYNNMHYNIIDYIQIDKSSILYNCLDKKLRVVEKIISSEERIIKEIIE